MSNDSVTPAVLADWASACGGRFMHLSEVSSTSDYLRSHWPAQHRAGAVWSICVADRQTAGRGRQGHVWHSASGAGLWCSLAAPVSPWAEADAADGRAQPPLSLVLAAALIDILRAEGFPVQLKWPNDLWLADRKVGGLLIEQLGASPDRYWLVGIGLNWRAPADLPRDKTGGRVDAGGVFEGDALSRDTAAYREALTAQLCRRAIDTIHAPTRWLDWMERANRYSALSGRWVQIWREGIPESKGRVDRIEPDGVLILMTDAGEIRVGGAASVRLLF